MTRHRARGVKRAGHSRPIVLVLMVAFALAGAAQQPADADPVLRTTRERLLADLTRMPRYTCVQTIKRQYFRPGSDEGSRAMLMTEPEQLNRGLVLRGWDRLRLEVAIVEGNDVYSWVGAPRFGGDTMEQLAGRGPLSSGDFGPFLNAILSSATITFKSEQRAGQKRLRTYAYDMPLDRSRYNVKCEERWVHTAYNGTLVIDADAGDIVSMTIRTTASSGSNPSCQAISEVEYGRSQIHDRMVLIPRQTRLIGIQPGSETRSLTTYSKCREYASTVHFSFGDTDGVAAKSTSPAQQNPSSPLPAGLHFRARIVTPIDSETAAAGDPVEAVLLSPIRGKDHRQWAPAGARLHGRLLDFEQLFRGFDYFRVSLEIESIELNGNAVPLRAAPDLTGVAGMGTVAGTFKLPVSVIPDPATSKNIFYFRKEHLQLEKFEWGWTTLPEHEIQPSAFPAGLRFRVRITTPIDSDTAVAGDPIEAVLLSPIPGKDGKEPAPAGARLHGQLVALKHYQLKSRGDDKFYVEFLVRFEFIELDGRAVPLRAAPILDPFGISMPYRENMLVIFDKRIRENLFLFTMEHLHLERLDWTWVTLPTQKNPPQSLPATLPAGAHFRARITTPIDSDTATSGDPIEGVLLSPVADKDGRELAPAGARLHGRLLGLKQTQCCEGDLRTAIMEAAKSSKLENPALAQEQLRRLDTLSIVEVVMQFDSVELNGSEVPIEAAPDVSEQSGLTTGAGIYVPEVFVVPEDVLKTNFFVFRGQHLHLENFDWNWTTLPAQESAQ